MGIVFSIGAFYASARLYFNDFRHLQKVIEELKKTDAAQDQRIATLENDIRWVKDALNRIEDKVNGVK